MESAFPPSYEEATSHDSLHFIAPYVRDSDLCSASLVSQAWHRTFAPKLWGNPASHFGTENDRVYVALTRFKRALPRARLHVRELTHTLHLPPAQAELYDGPHPEWLRDVLEKLPNLQCLVVSQIPFFDHASLFALKTLSPARALSSLELVPTYSLRLLIATQCQNTTPASLAEALKHWPNLVFLDLSETATARDAYVLSSLAEMPVLQVLKLRQIGMRDQDCEILADAVKTRLRSLDIRDNHLTDESVRTLLNKCFHKPRDVQAAQRRLQQAIADSEDWPAGMQRIDRFVLEQFRGDDMEERFVKQLTQSVVGRLPSEDLPPPGISHLYIANNFVTIEGLASLLKTHNLHVLDAGDLDTAKVLGRPETLSSLSSPTAQSFSVPGAEKLTGVLEKFSSKDLTSLRLHHALLTRPSGTKEEELHELDTSSSYPALPSPGYGELNREPSTRQELAGETAYPTELDAAAPIYELAVDAPTPRYELADNPIEIVVSPAADQSTFHQNVAVSSPLQNSPAVSALESDGDNDIDEVVLTPTGPSGFAQAANGISLPSRPEFEQPHSLLRDESEQQREDTIARISQLESRRQTLRHGVRDPNRGLLPGLLPCLRSLTITEVPTSTNSKTLIDNLRSFISDCALEHYLAIAQSDLEADLNHTIHRHSLHPRTQRRHNRIRAHPQSSSRLPDLTTAPHFSLHTLTLEPSALPSRSVSHSHPRNLQPSTNHLSPSTPTFPQSHHHKNSLISKRPKNWSSTEDPDTVAFWSAAENDFSFFDSGPSGEEEECGLPAVEPKTHVPISGLGEKEVVIPATDSSVKNRVISLPDAVDRGAEDLISIEEPSAPLQAPLHVLREADDIFGNTTSPSPSLSPSRGLDAESALEVRELTSLDSDRDGGNGREQEREQEQKVEAERVYDVVSELARWRMERKEAFRRVVEEQRLRGVGAGEGVAGYGYEYEYVEGYWPGEVKIVRSTGKKGGRGRSAGVDWYGNYFEGGVYR